MKLFGKHKESTEPNLLRNLEFTIRALGKRIGPDSVVEILERKVHRLEQHGPYRDTMLEMWSLHKEARQQEWRAAEERLDRNKESYEA